ncbi:MFS transporter [bacterium]|nr:MFS transporter [bacterium]
MKKEKGKGISGTVITLGLVSFFNDLSSEMIYPLLPLFLTSVLGAGALALGVIEGIAEATASILKIVSGYLTDKAGRKRPFVLAGYCLSSIMRPLMGIAVVWPMVLVLRFLDRVGKGIRTAPRDALIADVTDFSLRGRAYGFHRAMDHAGAVAGPLIAVFLLKGLGLSIRSVFLLAAFPSLFIIVLLLFALKEGKQTETATPCSIEDGTAQEAMSKDFKIFLLAIVLFTLGNSSDAFLLLRLNNAGVGVVATATLWSWFHVVKMVSTYTGGRISDKIGRKPMIIAGWIYYSCIYLMFAMFSARTPLVAAFLLYGLYFGFTEPVERAWVASFMRHDKRGQAFGYYHGAVGLASLPASLIFGFVWQKWGYQYSFITGCFFALMGCLTVSLVGEPY